jgi:hypothetical protein
MHVTVKCRVRVYAVMIVNVRVMFARKQYLNYNLFSFLILFLRYDTG